MRSVLGLALCCCLTTLLPAAAAASPRALRDLAFSVCQPPPQPSPPGGPCCGPQNCAISPQCGQNDFCCNLGRGGQAIGQACGATNNCCVGDCFNATCCSACSYFDAGPGVCACGINGTHCNSSSQCCTGVCNLATTNCVSGPSDCCALAGDCSPGLFCANAQCCIADGNAGYAGPCRQDIDCCNGDCDNNGVCQPRTACVNKGASCWDSPDCCAENSVADVCTPGGNAQSVCLYGPTHTCAINADCASGDCDNGICAPAGCTFSAGQNGCFENDDCCTTTGASKSPSCTPSGGSTTCCNPDLTAFAVGTGCGATFCCSANCRVSGGSPAVSYCAPIACVNTGGACGSTPDCCSGACGKYAGSLGQCCIPAGSTTCATAADCCVASSTCSSLGKCLSPNGTPCQGPGECQSNDCDVVSGRQQCVADLHGAVGSTCYDPADCSSGNCNSSLVCACNNVEGTCNTGTDCCVTGAFCTAGKCTSPIGSDCSQNSDCNSGRCDNNGLLPTNKCICAAPGTVEAALAFDEALCCDQCGVPETFFHNQEQSCTCEKSRSGKRCAVNSDCAGFFNCGFFTHTCGGL
jgi:hypothetical protein